MKKLLAVTIMLGAVASIAGGSELPRKITDETPAQKAERMAWWQNDRFGMWPKGADVWFGDQKTPVKIVGGDHVGNWANSWDGTKRGKKVFSCVWDVPHAERGEKYAPGTAFVYHWFIENPKPDNPIDKLTLGPGLAYFAITIEK